MRQKNKRLKATKSCPCLGRGAIRLSIFDVPSDTGLLAFLKLSQALSLETAGK
jgi:hypothetical protein